MCVRVCVCYCAKWWTHALIKKKKKKLCIVCLWFVCVWFVLCVHARCVLCVSFIIMCMWSPLSHHSNHNMTLKLVNSLCGKLGSSIVLKDFWVSFPANEVCGSVNSENRLFGWQRGWKKAYSKSPNHRQNKTTRFNTTHAQFVVGSTCCVCLDI